ncbi:DUF3418 domain-containing protein [Pseudomonas aeruginosa]|nr:DUF3418 domain-containing protein [Pseudomonas aeruginosa]
MVGRVSALPQGHRAAPGPGRRPGPARPGGAAAGRTLGAIPGAPRQARPGRRRDAELQVYRWMLEEYRVSLFAQQLGTRLPVSDKRLAKQWSQVEGWSSRDTARNEKGAPVETGAPFSFWSDQSRRFSARRMVKNRSVWSVRPVTLAACGP